MGDRPTESAYIVDDEDSCYRIVLLDPSYAMVDLVNGKLRLKKGALQVDADGMSIQIGPLLAAQGGGPADLLDSARHSGVIEFAAKVPRGVCWSVVSAKTDEALGESHGLVVPPSSPASNQAKRDMREAIIDACSWVARRRSRRLDYQ